MTTQRQEIKLRRDADSYIKGKQGKIESIRRTPMLADIYTKQIEYLDSVTPQRVKDRAMELLADQTYLSQRQLTPGVIKQLENMDSEPDAPTTPTTPTGSE